MVRMTSAHVLEDLVAAVESAGDPLLYERACNVLGALLSHYAGEP